MLDQRGCSLTERILLSRCGESGEDCEHVDHIYTLFEQVDAKSKVWSGYCAQLTNDSLMDRGR